MKIKVLLFTLPILFFIVISSCKKEKHTNEDLYEESKASGLTFYKNKDSILSPAGGSPHGTFKLKFNSAATVAFDSNGKLPAGGTFPNGSLIVKEVYSGGQIILYAVMKKSDSEFAANGWLWAEYKPDGGTEYSVSKKGGACTSCHSGSTNRDLVRTFDLH